VVVKRAECLQTLTTLADRMAKEARTEEKGYLRKIRRDLQSPRLIRAKMVQKIKQEMKSQLNI